MKREASGGWLNGSVIVEGGGGHFGHVIGVSVNSSRFPPRPRFRTSACFLNKTKDFSDAFGIGEELWKGAGLASGGKVPLACICVEWAVKEDMFYRL